MKDKVNMHTIFAGQNEYQYQIPALTGLWKR
jgi:hypothetical protein